ncbi:MAG: hypothetical protein N3A69_04005, partial [Leptospiraceae bacterium]|nr:hypothetical protein [Leptospiraceae bacterium]
MPNQEEAKRIIQSLVEKYEKLVTEGRINEYNEEGIKKNFLLPFFRALGWKTEDSSEVTTVEKVSKKRVDFSFKLNGIT